MAQQCPIRYLCSSSVWRYHPGRRLTEEETRRSARLIEPTPWVVRILKDRSPPSRLSCRPAWAAYLLSLPAGVRDGTPQGVLVHVNTPIWYRWLTHEAWRVET